MGVRGLTTYLQSDPRNFTEYQLHNTTVIIDGLNFLNFLYFDSGLYTQFNGEYLAFSEVIHRFINILKRCRINPIFVLDGCHDHFKLNTQMKRNYQRMQTCRTLLNSIKTYKLSSTNSLYNIQLLPPLTIITFIQTLNKLNIDYITCDNEADQIVMSLGIYLKCPIISNDSDFYITIPNHYDQNQDHPVQDQSMDHVSFLPLSLISFKPMNNLIKCNHCQQHKQLCIYLNCQKFLINGPGFKNLPYKQRSLLACLLGNDYISSNKFLKGLPISYGKTISLNNNANKQMKLKRRKFIILQLINWLSYFGTNIDKPIQCILNKYPKLERIQLYNQLMYSINNYNINSKLLYTIFNKYFKSLKQNINDNNTMEYNTCSIDSSSSSSSNTMKSVTTIPQHLSPLNSSCPSKYDKEMDKNQVLTIEEEEDDDDDDSRNTWKSITIPQHLSPFNSSCSSEYDDEMDKNQVLNIEEDDDDDDDAEVDGRNTTNSVTIPQHLSPLSSSYPSEYDKKIDETQELIIKQQQEDDDTEDNSHNTMKSIAIPQPLSPLNSSRSSEYDSEMNKNQELIIQEEVDDDDDGGVNELNEHHTNESIHHHHHHHNNLFPITSYWPNELLNSFRKYLILPIYIDSLLSYGTICLCCIESLYHYKSIYCNTIYLRTLIYNLLLGIESNYTLRYPNQLIGLNQCNHTLYYYIIEYDRKNAFYIKKRKIFVEPIQLLSLYHHHSDHDHNTDHNHNDELNRKIDQRLIFLQYYLNLDYNFIKLHNHWLISIALINVFYYKTQCRSLDTTNTTTNSTTNNTTNHIDDITQCPVSLTFGAICICTYLLTIHHHHHDNHLSYYKLLNKHYYKCANYFLKQIHSLININKTKKIINKKQFHTLNIDYVHKYGQLQIIYITLYTLIQLLDTIVTINEKNQLETCLNFLSIYFMFPSGYLFHNILYCINLIPSNTTTNTTTTTTTTNNNNNERYHYVRNVIIKELLNDHPHSNQYFNDALNLFDQYLQLCNDQFNNIYYKSLKKSNIIHHSNLLDNNSIKQNLLTIATINKTTEIKIKKRKKNCKPLKHNNRCKQLSYAEIEEKVKKIMLENDLFD